MTKILAVCLDCGDTLIDESTEVKNSADVSLRAELIPGAAELVRGLKKRGYPLALVADGPYATFPNNLGPYGLYELFDAYAISEIVGVAKPHPRIFQFALDQLHIPTTDYHRVMMVGNYLERDIKGANQLGLISVWLDWSPRRTKTPKDETERPQHIIKNPLELFSLIEVLEQRDTD
ncbi:MAG TPA: HAD family hydrolase [Phototrophicaceae bacterium]|nr:HAD family hydrolase [Phototrophicaceae bacterium]